jgi:hypothetical protein
MVETIAPVVHRGSRRKWGAAVTVHALGAVAGASALGAGLGLTGRTLGAPWGAVGLWAVAGVALLYSARELLGLAVPIPDRKRQVPEWWRTFFGPLTSSFLYGVGLGVGFLTYLRHGTLVAVGALAVATGDPAVGAAVLLPFGLARGVVPLVAWPARTSERATALMAKLDGWAMSSAPRVLNGVALVLLGGAAAVAAPSSRGDVASGLAAEVLAVVFGWAALYKVLAPRRWRADLESYRLPAPGAVALIVPLAEAAVPVLVLTGVQALAALLALVLLGTFSGAVLRARRLHGNRLPCGCFGGTVRRDFRVLLGRNLALAVVAVAAVGDTGDPWDLSGPEDLVPILLLGAGVATVLLLVREVRRLAATGT